MSEHQAPADAKQPTSSPGQLLLAARQQAGLDRAQLAKALRLSVQTIIDLESDDFRRFSAEIYLKGHMQAYARHCGIDPAPVLAAYVASGYDMTQQQIRTPVHMPTIATRCRASRRVAWRGQLMWWVPAAVVVLVVWVWVRHSVHAPTTTTAVVSSAKTAPDMTQQSLHLPKAAPSSTAVVSSSTVTPVTVSQPPAHHSSSTAGHTVTASTHSAAPTYVIGPVDDHE